jgi:putative nucleotidyltransferase with HDIG domain
MSGLASGTGLLLERFNLTHLAKYVAPGAVLVTALLLYPLFFSLHRRVLRSLEVVVRSDLEMASVLGAAIDQRDSDTGTHNFRVALYAIRLAEALGEARVDMIALVLGALLHDVGKIGIRDGVLLKPGPLTEAETAVMRTHIQKGLEIIGSSRWLQVAERVVRCHHERFDGLGYPGGLRGEDIPLEARIFAIVDVFDALTSHRPYHQALPFGEAMIRMEAEAGRHFDPDLLAAFWLVAEEAHHELSPASAPELLARLLAEVDRRREVLYTSEWIHLRVGPDRDPQFQSVSK